MGKRPHILVVEDNEPLRENLVEFLDQEGYAVEAVACSEEALAHLERMPLPDLVLLDLLMPGMGGRALAQAIRADPRWAAIRLVLITGAELGPAARAEVDLVLRKPFSIVELLGAIEQLSAAPVP